MKAKIVRGDMRTVGDVPETETEIRSVLRNGAMTPTRFWKVAATVDDPQAYMLVRMGVAEPADEECRERADRTPEQMKAAQYAYERQSRGIRPEDFERYDAGFISHVLPNGEYAPGPNAEMEDIDDDESEDE